jgi:hypothetical protein
LRMSREAPARSGSAPAASCCPTIRLWSSPNNSARWLPYFPGASILAWAVLPARTSSPCALCAATPPPAKRASPAMSRSCSIILSRPSPGKKSAPSLAGLEVPIWLLGSSLFSAQLAALLGLPFAFASHFAPSDLREALQVYREIFKPSEQLQQPYAMVAANVVVASTDAEARRLFTSVQQSFVNLRRGTPSQLPPPIDDIDSYASPLERATLNHTLTCSFVGSATTVARGLQFFLDTTQADELILTGHIYDHAARLRSFELVSQIRESLATPNRTQHAATVVAHPL